MLFTALLALASVFLPTGLEARDPFQRTTPPDLIRMGSLIPANRAGIAFSNFELHEHEIFLRRRTGALFAEYAFGDVASISASVPYTVKHQTDVETREHVDNINLALRFAHGRRDWRPVYGLDAFLATGSDEAGIGSRLLGNLVPYGGAVYFGGSFSFAAILRWNTQTNNQFQEDENVRFQRTWLIELAAGWSWDALEIFLEYERKIRYAPKENRLNTSVFAPGLNYRFGEKFQLGVSIPYTTSKEGEFDAGIVIRGTYFY